MSLVVRKPLFCIYAKNKDADQLCSNRTADQHICLKIATIPLLAKSKISSHLLLSVVVQPGLCQIWSATLKTGFLTMRLKFILLINAKMPKIVLSFWLFQYLCTYQYFPPESVGEDTGGVRQRKIPAPENLIDREIRYFFRKF